MKKIIIVCLALTMLVSLTLAVFAEPGGFVQSPSNNQAPVLVSGENESDECLAQLMITPYADRSDLPEEIRAKLEEAYDIIKNNPDLSALNEKIKDIAKESNLLVTDLAVSDMFDIYATDCVTHEDHGHFDIVLKSDILKNFVCLLHYYNNEWRIVENAEVTNNGTYLEFDEDEFSPFAIVVNTANEDVDTPPQTGDNTMIFIAIAVVSGLMLLILTIKYKKDRA